jgi:hypothetical protein
MPRANRYFLLGLVWHITHRCHRKAFLLKFARDREQLIELCGFTEAKEFQRAHHQWIEQSLEGELIRAAHRSEAIAVGRSTFVEKVQNELGSNGSLSCASGVQKSQIIFAPSFFNRFISAFYSMRENLSILGHQIPTSPAEDLTSNERSVALNLFKCTIA